MKNLEILIGKKALIVDDEPDVLETLGELLDVCHVDLARNFEDAKQLLSQNPYDFVLLDIMGVKGYELLKMANKKDTIVIMFTAHALSPNDFVKSIRGGAKAYIPKEKMSEIAIFVADVLEEQLEGAQKRSKWFLKLKTFFDEKFGSDWVETNREQLGKYGWFIWND